MMINAFRCKEALAAGVLVIGGGTATADVFASEQQSVDQDQDAHVRSIGSLGLQAQSSGSEFEAKRDDCLNTSFRNGQPSLLFRSKPRIRGQKVIRDVYVTDWDPTDGTGEPGSCDKAVSPHGGSRTLTLRPYQQNDKGQMKPNGPQIVLARNSNERIYSRRIDITVKHPYTCMKGKYKSGRDKGRNIDRRWLFKFVDKGAYGGKKGRAVTLIRDTDYILGRQKC